MARESSMKGPPCLRPICSLLYVASSSRIVAAWRWLYSTSISLGIQKQVIQPRPKVDIITQQATCFAPTRSSIFLLRLPGTAAVCPTDVTYLLAYRRILHQPSCRHSAVATTPYHTGDVLTKKSILDNTTNQKQSLCGARLKSRRAIRHIYNTTAQITWRRCLHLKKRNRTTVQNANSVHNHLTWLLWRARSSRKKEEQNTLQHIYDTSDFYSRMTKSIKQILYRHTSVCLAIL